MVSADEQHRPAGWVDRLIGRGTDLCRPTDSENPQPVTDFTLKPLLVGRRIAGLASEAAFWVIFSPPWLMLAFVSGLGVTAKYLGDEAVAQVRSRSTNHKYSPSPGCGGAVRAASAQRGL